MIVGLGVGVASMAVPVCKFYDLNNKLIAIPVLCFSEYLSMHAIAVV